MTTTFRPRTFLTVLSLAALAFPAHAFGQKWDLDFHGGFALGRTPNKGSKDTPAAGATFVMADGLQQSRVVSSWFFGDGTALFNQVMQLRGITTRITALDDSAWPQIKRKSGAQAGMRITRMLKSRIGIEGAFDFGMNPLGFTKAGLERIEASRSSFASAFLAMNNSTPTLLGNPTITATAALSDNKASQLLTTVSLVYRGATTGRSISYVLVGAGLNTPVGDGPSVTLTANYKLSTGPQTFNETDTVTLRTSVTRSPVYVVGGGVRRAMSPKTALRIEGRLFLNSNRSQLLLSAQPSVASGAAGVALVNNSSPGLQFSTRSDFKTNLSGAPISDFVAFRASGMQMQLVLSVGYVRTF